MLEKKFRSVVLGAACTGDRIASTFDDISPSWLVSVPMTGRAASLSNMWALAV